MIKGDCVSVSVSDCCFLFLVENWWEKQLCIVVCGWCSGCSFGTWTRRWCMRCVVVVVCAVCVMHMCVGSGLCGMRRMSNSSVVSMSSGRSAVFSELTSDSYYVPSSPLSAFLRGARKKGRDEVVDELVGMFVRVTGIDGGRMVTCLRKYLDRNVRSSNQESIRCAYDKVSSLVGVVENMKEVHVDRIRDMELNSDCVVEDYVVELRGGVLIPVRKDDETETKLSELNQLREKLAELRRKSMILEQEIMDLGDELYLLKHEKSNVIKQNNTIQERVAEIERENERLAEQVSVSINELRAMIIGCFVGGHIK